MQEEKKLRLEAAERLAAAGDADAAADADWIACEVLHVRRSQLPFTPMDEAAREKYRALVARREAGEPLQYVIGSQPFYGRVFAADSRALIPRFETEEVCEAALARIAYTPRPRVLDIGTGTGALALTIALERPDSIVTAVDISPEALSLARENALALGAKCEFMQGDLYAPVAGRQFDLIISNPPYIPTGELAGLQREVLREPMLALDGGADGLDFYRAIGKDACRMLAPGGVIVLEVGAGQADAVASMLDGLEFAEIICDMNGIERIVAARKTTAEETHG